MVAGYLHLDEAVMDDGGLCAHSPTDSKLAFAITERLTGTARYLQLQDRAVSQT